jgi:hypothetical protein
VADCSVFLADVASDFFGGSRVGYSTFRAHDVVDESLQVVAATNKLLLGNMDGGFISAFFPFLSVSVSVSSVPVGLSFGVRSGLFLVAAVGTGCGGLFSTLTHDGKGKALSN